jgi:hypothetical protein
MVNRRRTPEPIAGSATLDEAIAIVAALERFRRATAKSTPSGAPDPNRWLRAAIVEGVSRQMDGDDRDPWINT